MSEDKKKSQKFADKGFYIVLFVCVAIVGIASWALLFSNIRLEEAREASTVTEPVEMNHTPTAKPTQPKTPEPQEAQPPEPTEEPKTEEPAVSVWQETETGAEATEPEDEPEDDDDIEDTETALTSMIRPLYGAINVSHSMSELVYDATMADWRTHDGIDIEAQVGSCVRSVQDGTVEKVYNDDMYGTTVIIAHAGGVRSIYSNLASIPTVEEGDTVECGAIIGSVGSTAAAETGEVSHLHFAMTANEKSVDPLDYLPKQ